MTFGLELARLSQAYPRLSLIKNLKADMVVIEVGDHDFPLTIPDLNQVGNTWTVSFSSMVLGYGKEELARLPRGKRLLLSPLLGLLQFLFKGAKADDMIGVENACLSTNLVSQALRQVDLPTLREKIYQHRPGSSLMIRSLNEHDHADFLEKLRRDGWHLLVNRQVYLIDQPEKALKKRDSKRDLALLDDPDYRFRRLRKDSPTADFEAVIALYDQLYLEKYSKLSVQFTPLLLREMIAADCLELYLLEDGQAQAKGCLGMIVEDGILTVPILGYDLTATKETALYRRLSIFITDYCAKHQLQQHLSAGAASFKKNRGAIPYLEYTAVYSRHLSLPRRLFWKGLAFLTRTLYAPLLQKNGL